MSIVWRGDAVVLLDHADAANRTTKEVTCHDRTGVRTQQCMMLRHELFACPKPYIQPPSDSGSKSKRKRAHLLNDGEESSLQHHEEVLSRLRAGLATLNRSTTAVVYFRKQAELAGQVHDVWDGHKVKSLGPGTQLKQLTELARQSFSTSAAALPGSSCASPASKLTLSEDGDHSSMVQDGMFSAVIEHACQHPCLVDIPSGRFVLPALSTFLMSDICDLGRLAKLELPYDVIVMDPPWENKSAARSQRYDTMPVWKIGKMPLDQLATPHALVAIWMTNKRRLNDLVRSSLLPKWKLSLLAEWQWLKVTSSGEPVVPFDSAHKRSYETLLLCRRYCDRSPETCQTCRATPAIGNQNACSVGPAAKRVLLPDCNRSVPESRRTASLVRSCISQKESAVVTRKCDDALLQTSSELSEGPETVREQGATAGGADQSCHHQQHCKQQDGGHLELGSASSTQQPVPRHMTIVSVPSKIHSHKPPLSDVLLPYIMADEPRCLELFSRTLLPGWTSVGNEALLLQHVDFFHCAAGIASAAC